MGICVIILDSNLEMPPLKKKKEKEKKKYVWSLSSMWKITSPVSDME